MNGKENPELLLIDAVADEIVDDEHLIEGLGDGTLALEDVERWLERRAAEGPRRVERWRAQVAEMRRLGFSRMMRHGGEWRTPPRARELVRDRVNTRRRMHRAQRPSGRRSLLSRLLQRF